MRVTNKIIIISLLFFLVIILTLHSYYGYNKNVENFNIESVLDKSAGFYSELFFLLNHYLYCKINKQNFKINSEEWTFKYKNGWTDYFEPVELKFNDGEYIKKGHGDIVDNYKLSDYQIAINEIYIYNNNTFNLETYYIICLRL